jgi:GTP-binding protein EngB required for normal cell division
MRILETDEALMVQCKLGERMPNSMQVDNSTPTIDLLPGYTDTKLKLASIVEILLTFVRERKDEDRIRTIQRLLADLAEDAFRLAVVGKYNRGKSSLMNAMLGGGWLPTGILPLTSVVTTVRYGTKQRVSIRTAGSSFAHEIALKDVPQYVSEEYNPGNQKNVDLAEISLPSDLLRYGFLFIDTPGLASGITANTEATRKFLPEVDAAIVVLSFESPLDQTDLDLLESFRRLQRKVFVVVNKADLVSPDERDRVTSFLQRNLAAHLGECPPLFSLSARDAVSARLQDDEAALGQSGLKEFEGELIHFLITQKAEIFLRRVIERTRNLLEQEELEYILSEQLNLNSRKADELRSMQEQKEILSTQLNEAFTRLQQQYPTLFYNLLENFVNSWSAEQKDLVPIEADKHLAARCGDLSESIRARTASATEQLRESAKHDLADLSRAFIDLKGHGDGLLGRSASSMPVDDFEMLGGILGRDIEIPKLPVCEWSVPKWMQDIPWMWLRKIATPGLKGEFSLALASYRDNIRTLLEQSCRRWLERAQREAQQTVEAYTLRFETLHERSNIAEKLPMLRDLSQQLSEVVQSLEASPHSVDYSDAKSDDSFKLCSICRKISDATFHFFSRFQYELTRDRKLQAEVGRSGGLCPFHTWMYESVGSPQGIAQGYATVLESLAERLEETIIAETSTRLSQLVSGLLPNNNNTLCKACQITSSTESLALDEIASTDPPQSSHHHVCLIHLAPLIARLKDPGRAKRYVERQAAQFRRVAQDMRQFALKHNALRHHLSTEGESDAYLHGLMQLVGVIGVNYFSRSRSTIFPVFLSEHRRSRAVGM